MYELTVQQVGKEPAVYTYKTDKELCKGVNREIGRLSSFGFSVRLIDTPDHVRLQHQRYPQLLIDLTVTGMEVAE